jgi:hypothetical protein
MQSLIQDIFSQIIGSQGKDDLRSGFRKKKVLNGAQAHKPMNNEYLQGRNRKSFSFFFGANENNKKSFRN